MTELEAEFEKLGNEKAHQVRFLKSQQDLKAKMEEKAAAGDDGGEEEGDDGRFSLRFQIWNKECMEYDWSCIVWSDLSSLSTLGIFVFTPEGIARLCWRGKYQDEGKCPKFDMPKFLIKCCRQIV